MKKLLAGLCLTFAPALAFAHNATTTPTTSTTTQAQIVCAQNAIEKRDTAIINAHDVFGTSIKTALQKRMLGLKNAFAVAEKKDRILARNAVWKTYKTDAQAAHNALRTIRNTSWKTYDTELKACGIKGGTGETPVRVLNPNLSL